MMRRTYRIAGVLGLAVLTGCRSEEEARARRLGGLRDDAQRAVAALDEYCAARDVALDSFAAGVPGWERALEEVLRAPDAADEYCEMAATPHEHEGGAAPPRPADTAAAR